MSSSTVSQSCKHLVVSRTKCHSVLFSEDVSEEFEDPQRAHPAAARLEAEQEDKALR